MAADAIAEADDGLSEKERRFCDAYAGDAAGNGAKACRMAGYEATDASLATIAWRLLRKVDIKRAIDARMESDPLVAGRVERLRFLTSVLRGEITDEKLDGEGSRVELRVDSKARLAAEAALSKVAGEHVQKVALTNSAGDDIAGVPLSELLALRNG